MTKDVEKRAIGARRRWNKSEEKFLLKKVEELWEKEGYTAAVQIDFIKIAGLVNTGRTANAYKTRYNNLVADSNKDNSGSGDGGETRKALLENARGRGKTRKAKKVRFAPSVDDDYDDDTPSRKRRKIDKVNQEKKDLIRKMKNAESAKKSRILRKNEEETLRKQIIQYYGATEKLTRAFLDQVECH